MEGYSYKSGGKISKVHLSNDGKTTLCGRKIEVWYFKTAEKTYCVKCEKAAKVQGVSNER